MWELSCFFSPFILKTVIQGQTNILYYNMIYTNKKQPTKTLRQIIEIIIYYIEINKRWLCIRKHPMRSADSWVRVDCGYSITNYWNLKAIILFWKRLICIKKKFVLICIWKESFLLFLTLMDYWSAPSLSIVKFYFPFAIYH